MLATALSPDYDQETQLRFLALGDSYTIGEGVPVEVRWPMQLVVRLAEAGYPLDEPEIIARTGWTTDELANALELAAPLGPYDIVSLLIGVNNQYRGRDVEEYRQQFNQLLERAISLAGGDPGNVLVLSIPDWGVTPYAEGRDTARITTEVDAFNAVNREEASRAGTRYIDVTPASRLAASDPELIASDGLHPSGKLYAAWVELLLPEALAALAE
jgi:lysophospholipase L1-like esterase